MKKYLDIVKHVLNNGQWKAPVRKNDKGEYIPVDGGVKTLTCANVLFSHNMEEGFPLLTTKRVAFKTMCVELEGFIKGITSKQWYNERKCKIWNEWCNPTITAKLIKEHIYNSLEKTRSPSKEQIKEWQKQEDDLGPIYGYQWRRFNECYSEDVDGDLVGADQLANIVDTLRNNYNDRRMVCSAWNPNQMHAMALPPCHWGWNVTAVGDTLNLFWVQRSCDLMYGVPFNIASYALLLTLLCREGGLKPGNLSCMLVDCHIYDRQIEAAKEQIQREPRKLPTIQLIDEGCNIFTWTYKDIILQDYNPNKKLDFGEIVI